MYGGWVQGQGAIHCWMCFFGDFDLCPACENKRAIQLKGDPEDHIEGDPYDVFRSVQLIVKSALHEFPKSAMDYLNQPAKWIAAFEFLYPFVSIEEEAKRKREDGKRKS